MKIRSDIVELLRAGYSDRAIARQLNVDPVKTVARARNILGLPKAKPGHKAAASPEDLFWRRTQPTDDGHLLWTGSLATSGGPSLRHGGRNISAYRIAKGRDPQGYALPSCGRHHCVKPGHHADQADRVRQPRRDIADMLRAGVPQIQIARTLNVAPVTVQRARVALGLPAAGRGRHSIYASLEDAFHQNTQLLDGGHLAWTGSVDQAGVPRVGFRAERLTAFRLGFRLYYGRDPEGAVRSACGMSGCVAGAHLEDKRIREANQRADAAFEEFFGRSS